MKRSHYAYYDDITTEYDVCGNHLTGYGFSPQNEHETHNYAYIFHQDDLCENVISVFMFCRWKSEMAKSSVIVCVTTAYFGCAKSEGMA